MKDFAPLAPNPADWTLTQTVDAMTAGQASATEVAQAAPDRIASRQPMLDRFNRIDDDRAMEQATALDLDRARGVAPGPLPTV
jgi:Asp-tRNA(Asn)/Glu-tRNA(Gln) amidotransferase A subunit family amidase